MNHKFLTKFMAAKCEWCPPCRYARNHPGNWFAKLMAWHGRWCPFWKAWDKVHGSGDRKE